MVDVNHKHSVRKRITMPTVGYIAPLVVKWLLTIFLLTASPAAAAGAEVTADYYVTAAACRNGVGYAEDGRWSEPGVLVDPGTGNIYGAMSDYYTSSGVRSYPGPRLRACNLSLRAPGYGYRFRVTVQRVQLCPGTEVTIYDDKGRTQIAHIQEHAQQSVVGEVYQLNTQYLSVNLSVTPSPACTAMSAADRYMRGFHIQYSLEYDMSASGTFKTLLLSPSYRGKIRGSMVDYSISKRPVTLYLRSEVPTHRILVTVESTDFCDDHHALQIFDSSSTFNAVPVAHISNDYQLTNTSSEADRTYVSSGEYFTLRLSRSVWCYHHAHPYEVYTGFTVTVSLAYVLGSGSGEEGVATEQNALLVSEHQQGLILCSSNADVQWHSQQRTYNILRVSTAALNAGLPLTMRVLSVELCSQLEYVTVKVYHGSWVQQPTETRINNAEPHIGDVFSSRDQLELHYHRSDWCDSTTRRYGGVTLSYTTDLYMERHDRGTLSLDSRSEGYIHGKLGTTGQVPRDVSTATAPLSTVTYSLKLSAMRVTDRVCVRVVATDFCSSSDSELLRVLDSGRRLLQLNATSDVKSAHWFCTSESGRTLTLWYRTPTSCGDHTGFTLHYKIDSQPQPPQPSSAFMSLAISAGMILTLCLMVGVCFLVVLRRRWSGRRRHGQQPRGAHTTGCRDDTVFAVSNAGFVDMPPCYDDVVKSSEEADNGDAPPRYDDIDEPHQEQAAAATDATVDTASRIQPPRG